MPAEAVEAKNNLAAKIELSVTSGTPNKPDQRDLRETDQASSRYSVYEVVVMVRVTRGGIHARDAKQVASEPC